jgi:hypothetical protein
MPVVYAYTARARFTKLQPGPLPMREPGRIAIPPCYVRAYENRLLPRINR